MRGGCTEQGLWATPERRLHSPGHAVALAGRPVPSAGRAAGGLRQVVGM